MDSKNFNFIFLSSFLCLLFIIGGFNYIVNPHSKYQHRIFRPLTSTSHKDKYYLLKKYVTSPDVIILGSSRSASLDPDYINTRTSLNTFNSSVNAAMMEDLFTINRFINDYYEDKPKLYLIGLDLRMFKPKVLPNDGLEIFFTLGQDFNNTNLYNRIKSHWSFFKSLFSIQQARDAMKVFVFEYLISWPEPKGYYSPNGMLIYNNSIEKDRHSLASKIKETNELYINNIYDDYAGMDLNRLRILEDLLLLNHDHNVEVKLFLTPLHPLTKKYLDSHGIYSAHKQQLIEYLKELTHTHPFEFYDLSDIATFEGLAEEFYDGEHIRVANGHRILDYIFIDSKLGTLP